jgi:AraC-like DNA-binding protein
MATIARIFKIAQTLAKPDQLTETSIPSLRFVHSSRPTPLNHGVLKPSFCLILGGEKQIQIGTRTIKYGPGDYLISTVEIPTSGRIRGANPKSPYLGLSLQIDPKEITAIVTEAEIEFPRTGRKIEPGAFVAKSDREIRAACWRLIQLLVKSRPSKYLAEQIKREILYHLLTGPDGALFYQNVVTRQSEAGIARAIQWIKANLDQPLKMAELAKVAGMSVSGLHHKFKAITTKGPLQYQKQLRLVEARQLLLTGGFNVAAAASEVGYASQSQFTREYRRLFGQPPTKDLRRLRQIESAVLQN